MQDIVAHQTLIITEDSHIGVCFCATMQIGDEIALVAGSRFPMVLRPVPEQPGFYTLVGLAKVNGLMNSEEWPKDLDVESLPTITLV